MTCLTSLTSFDLRVEVREEVGLDMSDKLDKLDKFDMFDKFD